MHRFVIALSLTFVIGGCSRTESTDPAHLDRVRAGTIVTIEQQDGVTVEGRLVEVRPEHVVIEADGVQKRIARKTITALRTPSRGTAPTRPDAETPAAAGGAGDRAVPTSGDAPHEGESSERAAPERDAADESDPAGPAVRTPAARSVTLPAGTILKLTLRTTVASDASRLEDPVRATLRQPLVVDGNELLPAGTLLTGHVTSAKRAARVKGRGQIAVRFTRIDLPGPGNVERIRTTPVARVAPGTKKRDAATIGGGAVGGAIIGGILGGGDGAAKGAAIGGAAGTGAVLATRGREARLAAGTAITVRLTGPLTVPAGPGASTR